MGKLKEALTNWRILLMIIAIILAVIMISPKISTHGVIINDVEQNSSADINGISSGQILLSINGREINSVDEYYAAANQIENNSIVKFYTKDKTTYSLVAQYANESTLGITVKEIPSSNIQQGLDLIGGVRVLLKPEGEITQQQMDDLITITQKRLNTYGLKDIPVREVSDWEGNQFLLIEIAGATKGEVVDLISGQGKFEAKIGNESVFVGGQDIKQVERSAQSGAGIRECGQSDGGWYCQFMFPVYVSPESAKKHAEVTNKLEIILVGNEQYLSEKLDMYIDDVLVDSLYISSSLKGQEATNFVIEGSGTGATEAEAQQNAIDNMKKMQTILITGSLPVKLSVAKIDIVSPTLGKEFFRSTLIAIFAAIAAVGAVIFIRYRKLKIAIPIMITGLSEVLILLGVAAFIRWNLDLAAIAGILAVIGTGVDDQIVITDEVLGTKVRGSAEQDWKTKMKMAFFIIFAAYSTVVVAMLPLMAMGAGLLKGFAIITILGVTIGVFITRPAYAKLIEILLKE